MITLDKAKRTKTYKIVGFQNAQNVQVGVLRRFFELGFETGEKIKMLSTSLQRKVFLIEIRGYLLSVRTSLLACVQVEIC